MIAKTTGGCANSSGESVMIAERRVGERLEIAVDHIPQGNGTSGLLMGNHQRWNGLPAERGVDFRG